MPGEEAAQTEVSVGILASPGVVSELAATFLPELAEKLAARLPDLRWSIEVVEEGLVDPPVELSELIAAGRRAMLDRGWHLALCVTDLPLQTARRPVIAHASAAHGVAVLSLPALGPVGVRRRAISASVRLVEAMLGAVSPEGGEEAGGGTAGRRPSAAVARRARELGGRLEADDRGMHLVARVITGNVWLLLGMLRANRPWRLAIRLSRVLVAAAAAVAAALVTSDIWRLADHLGHVRLSVLTIGSVLAMTLTIVIGANLWERHPNANAREQVMLFNIVTVTTVIIGVVVFYIALFLIAFAGAAALVPDGFFASVLRHPVDFSDHLDLAWLAASIATVGGALGAGLESDDAVREAAYTYRPDTPLTGRT
ncbi:MAG: hypothetical protein JWQ95_1801 [Sphaerisporangium sp.]|nr:hypothetical protein [Sphaerisporangium sp.]